MDTLIKIIKILTGIVLVFLGLEVVLRLLGAQPTIILFQWIYEISGIFKSPFAEVIEPWVFGNRFVLDFSALFAMVAYSILAAILIWLIQYVSKGGKKH